LIAISIEEDHKIIKQKDNQRSRNRIRKSKIKKNMRIKLPKRDWKRIRRHLSIDLSYREEGTFSHSKDGEFPFDEKEAERVEKIINNINNQYKKYEIL